MKILSVAKEFLGRRDNFLGHTLRLRYKLCRTSLIMTHPKLALSVPVTCRSCFKSSMQKVLIEVNPIASLSSSWIRSAPACL